jgi:Domain of unknown function (DUF4136)
MHPSGRWNMVAALGIAALGIAGCATMQVSSYVARGSDFARYHSYSWAPDDQLRTGDPRLDNNPFFLDRLQADVDRGLASRGLEKNPQGQPDLLVHYHVNISQEVHASQLEVPYGDTCTGCEPYVYDAGTLLIDFVDARTNTLVWRGWAEGSMDNAIDNQAFMERKIDDAVNRILKKLPPAL